MVMIWVNISIYFQAIEEVYCMLHVEYFNKQSVEIIAEASGRLFHSEKKSYFDTIAFN